MRRITALLAVLALVVAGAVPAMATHEEEPVHPPIIEVDPGDSVEVLDGIWIEVETNGTVRVTDGIFVQKFSTGGQPLTISVRTPNSDFTRVVVVCDDKICA